MALEPAETDRRRTVGEVPHDALMRVDRRVTQILARRETTLRARRAAEHLKGAAR
jgi:hypothetical protein